MVMVGPVHTGEQYGLPIMETIDESYGLHLGMLTKCIRELYSMHNGGVWLSIGLVGWVGGWLC